MVVSDGAPWIENTADRVFGRGRVTYILDQFHVLETLRAAVTSSLTACISRHRVNGWTWEWTR